MWSIGYLSETIGMGLSSLIKIVKFQETLHFHGIPKRHCPFNRRAAETLATSLCPLFPVTDMIMVHMWQEYIIHHLFYGLSPFNWMLKPDPERVL